MAYQNIIYEKDGNLAVITFNRPDALNAISPELEAEFHRALDEADADADVRVIIVTGAGRAFSAGYDMAPRSGPARRPDPKTAYTGEYLRSWWGNDFRNIQYLMHLWYLSKPVIAAVNGWCMGGAFWYAAACDITIASDQATFAQPEVRQISNTTFLFAALCGWKVANRYALTGDHLDAPEAYRIGLINEVVPHDELMERAKALAHRIALVPEPSVRFNKYVTTLGLEAMGIRSALLVNAAMSTMAHSSFMPEQERLNEARATGGMRAFLDMRDAPFQPEPFGPRSRNRPGSLR